MLRFTILILNSKILCTKSKRSACSSKPAVFYDFIVPFADIQNHFGITVDDPMRLVGATSINGATVLGSTASDIAGINDDNYANTIAGQDKAFSDFLKYQQGSSSSSATGFGVLPVELVKFEVLPTNGTNLIAWTTGMELNNDYFVIEKSLNGKDFHSIGEVNGYGKSSHEIDCNFIDKAPYENTYYRLKQVDLDGSVEYSKVILAKQDRKSRVSYSIKDAGKFIKVNPANNKTSVSIFNIQGALVKTMMISDVTIIDYNNLSAGIYSIIIKNTNERISQSFIVK